MASRLIELHGYASAEIVDGEDGMRDFVLCNEQCQIVRFTIESARLLYDALRTFDEEGLLCS